MSVEEYIKAYTRNCSNELVSVQDKNGKEVISYSPWITPDHARSVADIAKEEVIEKAASWLYKQLNEGTMECRDMEKFIDDFKQAMENRL